MNWDLTLEILGFTIGLVYLWYEYHANAKVWLASVVMPMISMWIYFRKGLYADFAINIYYVAIAVYGYLHWTLSHHSSAGSERSLPISRCPRSVAGWCLAAMAVLWLGIYLLLTMTDSTVPVADAFTTALSIVALWMMARKYVEQWLVWMVVDAVCVGLYCYKGIYFYAVLYAVYTAVAWLGYRKWLRSMIPAPNEPSDSANILL